MKKTKFKGVFLTGSELKPSIQVRMFLGGKTETETLTMDHSAGSQKACYNLKLQAETGFKNKTLNYALLFPNSEKKHKYISRRGDNITIVERLDEEFNLLRAKERQGKLSTSTLTGYVQEIARLQSYFKDECEVKKLFELEPSHLIKWAEFRNVVQHSIDNELRHIRSIIKTAIGRNEIVRNILFAWKPIVSGDVVLGKDDNGEEIVKEKYCKDPYTKKEVSLILAATKEIWPDIYSFNLFRFALGMRPSEIRGLCWSHYNELNNSVLIQRVIVRNIVKETPKTKAGIRTLKLNKMAIEAIEIQKKLTYDDGGYIFTNPNGYQEGKFWGENGIRNRWRDILKHAGVSHRRPYNTRHTFVTNLVSLPEMSNFNLSKLVGHASTKTIEKYAGGMKEEEPLDTSAIDFIFNE